MAVWTYYILRDLKPEALENLPEASDRRVATEAESPEAANGNNGVNGEVSDGEATTDIVTPSSEATPVTNTDTNPEVTSEVTPEVTPEVTSEVPEASEVATNGTNGSEASTEAVEASDKVPSTVESEVGFLEDHSFLST